MNLINISDYIFYRIYMFYQDGKAYSSSILSAIEFFTILSAVAIFKIYFEFSIDKYFYIILLIIVMALNALRYERKDFDVKALHEKWKDESPMKKKLRGWAIFLYTATVVIFPIAFGYLRNNLGVI